MTKGSLFGLAQDFMASLATIGFSQVVMDVTHEINVCAGPNFLGWFGLGAGGSSLCNSLVSSRQRQMQCQLSAGKGDQLKLSAHRDL